jgi:Ca2+-binding RTX toxin-like protein
VRPPWAFGLFVLGLVATGVLVVVALGENEDANPGDWPPQGAESLSAVEREHPESEQISGSELEGEEEGYESAAEEVARAGEESRVLFERQAAFIEPRAFPRNRIPPGSLLRAQRQAEGLAAAPGGVEFVPTESGPAEFERAPAPADDTSPSLLAGPALSFASRGPTKIDDNGTTADPFTGRISAIATHPTQAGTAYVGAATGGVWKTTDHGATWTPIFDAQPSLAIGAIAVNPANPSIMYVGTGEANGSVDSYYGTGLYRSANGGSTWTKIPAVQADGCWISDIEIGPDPNRVLVGVADYSYGARRGPGTCTKGVWRSTNDGSTWSNRGLNPTSIAAVPGAPAIVYAGSAFDGLYKSTDGGATWSKLSATYVPSSEMGRVEVATGASNANRVWAAFATADGGSLYAPCQGGGCYYSSLLRSDNAGVTWDTVGVDSQPFPWYSMELAVNPGNSLLGFFGGVHPYAFSGDLTGDTDEFLPGTTHADLHAIAYDASGRAWLGTDGGVYRVYEEGNAITNANGDGIPTIQFNHGFAGDPDGRLIGGTQDNGTVTTTASGTVPWLNVLGCDGGAAAVDPVAPATLYMTTQYTCGKHLIRKSTDGGATSTLADSGVDLTQPGGFYPPFLMDPGDRSTLYVGLNDVFVTHNGAESWTKLGSQSLSGKLSALGAATSDDTLYAGTELGKLGRYRAGSWVDVTGTLPERWVNDIWVDPDDSAHALVGLSGFGTGHLYETANSGGTWTNVSGNLPDTPVNAIEVDLEGGAPLVFAGTDVGVFSSDDNGVTWSDSSGNLPNTVVSDLLFDPSSSKLVVATHGRGAFTASVPVTRPPNDSLVAAKAIVGNVITQQGSNVAATKQSGEPNHAGNAGGASIWYRWQAPSGKPVTIDTAGSDFDTLLAVYTGGYRGIGTLIPTVANDDAAGTRQSAVTFTPNPGTTYQIAVDGYQLNGTAAQGNVMLHLGQAPGNDHFADAVQLTGTSATRPLDSNRGATKEPSEPNHASTAGGASVWYRWQAPTDGTVTIDTIGSSFDTLLAAYTGAGYAAPLTVVAANDDIGGSPAVSQSRIQFNATEDTVYRIAVDGYPRNGVAATGDLKLSLRQRPPNDLFANATVLTGSDVTRTGDTNESATKEAGEPYHVSETGGASVWYRWEAPHTEMVTIDTGGSSFDTLLAVYQGTAVGSLPPAIASNDDRPGGTSLDTSSRVDFAATAGQTYRIVVDGYGGATGSIELHVVDESGLTARCDGATPTITGTGTAEVINGTAGDDVIVGLGGDDVINGLGGNDKICGNDGEDRASGGLGDDYIAAETVDFSATNAGGSIDLAEGTAAVEGADTLVGAHNATGSGGANVITGPLTSDPVSLDGGGGSDQITDGNAAATITGGPGIDQLNGGRGSDRLIGNADGDHLFGGPGEDSLAGGTGNDELDGHAPGAGSDNWEDTLDLSAVATGMVVDLGAGSASGEGTDTVAGFDLVIGSNQIDQITGSTRDEHLLGGAEADVLKGAGGTDALEGEQGDDNLAGGPGDDQLVGGEGDDTADFSTAAAGITVALDPGTATGEGTDNLDSIINVTGSPFVDRITGSDDPNMLLGGPEADEIDGLGGADRIEGGDGDDAIEAGLGVDDVLGDAGADRITTRDGQLDMVECGADPDAVIADADDITTPDCETVELPDTSAPDTVITSGPSGRTSDATPKFKFRATEPGSSFECKIDSQPYEACSSPTTLKRLDKGRHVFRVQATDAAGNVDPTPASRGFKVVR